MLSLREGRWGCHVEFTRREALTTIQELGRLRVHYREHYPGVLGNAMVAVRSAEDLRQLVDGMTPRPEGFLYNVRVDVTQDLWEAVFVPWAD